MNVDLTACNTVEMYSGIFAVGGRRDMNERKMNYVLNACNMVGAEIGASGGGHCCW